MSTQAQLPAYKSHKTVRAAKITAFRQNGNPDMPDLVLGDISCIVSLLPDWHQKHKPKVGGYLVQYEDGYQSYSPAKAFEEGYTEVQSTGQLTQSADSGLLPHQQRVVDEKDEVGDRLSKLFAFFEGPIFWNLDEAERSRLRNQARFMDGYAAVLEERIAAFAPVSSQPANHPV